MERDEVLHTSPYVLQVEKFADSLKRLSKLFVHLDDDRTAITNQEIEEMFLETKEQVCVRCKKCNWCWGEDLDQTDQINYEIFSAIDGFGDELNIEIKRKMESKCLHASEYLHCILGIYHNRKQNIMWEKRIASNREGCATQLSIFADMLCSESKELEDSIISDSRMEKKIEAELLKAGVRILYVTIMINAKGRYEIYLTACAKKGIHISYQEFAEKVSLIMGKRMITQNIRQGSLGNDYTTTLFVEGPSYYSLYGVAKIGKDCEQISGDNFMVIDLPGERRCMALSDGMGAGEAACKESGRIIDLLEELLKAGYPENTAIQMINTSLTIAREEVNFSTIDLCTFELYEGKCRMYKAGASTTFIKRGGIVEHINSTSLPIGVVQNLSVDYMERQLDHGDFVIMVTDGIMDALPVGEQNIILETIIKGTEKNNAKEMAHHILEQVLEWNGKEAKDDMSVLVASLWRFV